jgi:hypothetical protein
VNSAAPRRPWAALALLALLTLGEVRLFDRMLFEGHADSDFVLDNIDGILHGRPVSKSWQQRLIGPAAVTALGKLTADRRQALRWFTWAMLLLANLVLFALRLRKDKDTARALVVVALFGLARALTLYRLEYPWDGIDVLGFLAFGAAAAQDRALSSLWLLLIIGTFNHETSLYIPLWYLLAPLERARSDRHRRREWIGAAVVTLAIGGCIFVVRQRLYVGRPNWPGQTFEVATPMIDNHLHVAHNLRQWLIYNWASGRAFISVALSVTVALLLAQIMRRQKVRPSIWSALIIVTIVCFGYVNETRHYLVLLAFWFAYL